MKLTVGLKFWTESKGMDEKSTSLKVFEKSSFFETNFGKLIYFTVAWFQTGLTKKMKKYLLKICVLCIFVLITVMSQNQNQIKSAVTSKQIKFLSYTAFVKFSSSVIKLGNFEIWNLAEWCLQQGEGIHECAWQGWIT